MNKTLATVLIAAVLGLLGYAVYQSLYYSQTEEISHDQLADSVKIPEAPKMEMGAPMDKEMAPMDKEMAAPESSDPIEELGDLTAEEEVIDSELEELAGLDF